MASAVGKIGAVTGFGLSLLSAVSLMSTPNGSGNTFLTVSAGYLAVWFLFGGAGALAVAGTWGKNYRRCLVWSGVAVGYTIVWLIGSSAWASYVDNAMCRKTIDAMEELAASIEGVRVREGHLPKDRDDLVRVIGYSPVTAWGNDIEYLVECDATNAFELVAVSADLFPWVFEYSSAASNKSVRKGIEFSFDRPGAL